MIKQRENKIYTRLGKVKVLLGHSFLFGGSPCHRKERTHGDTCVFTLQWTHVLTSYSHNAVGQQELAFYDLPV